MTCSVFTRLPSARRHNGYSGQPVKKVCRSTFQERRYLEHINMEMELYATRRKAESLDKQRELLAAWERDQHVRNLKKLQPFGPAAMRSYARETLAKAGAATLGASGSAPTLSSVAVGYDPRDAARSD